MALQCGALAVALGMGHPDLLAFIRACTPARWTLVYRMLAELADRGMPSSGRHRRGHLPARALTFR